MSMQHTEVLNGVSAAQYVRMSTEPQKYSTQNQADAIASYAARHDIEIVRTYADEGRSGLKLDGREALKELISDVLLDRADFDCILVYDVSRWGRFQDADESAHYKFICREAGVQVQYCAEEFQNDGSATSNIVKNLKRVMAAEYNRELKSAADVLNAGSRVAVLAGQGALSARDEVTQLADGRLGGQQRNTGYSERGCTVTLWPVQPSEVIGPERNSRQRRGAWPDLDAASGIWRRIDGEARKVRQLHTPRARRSTSGVGLDLCAARCRRRQLCDRPGVWFGWRIGTTLSTMNYLKVERHVAR